MAFALVDSVVTAIDTDVDGTIIGTLTSVPAGASIIVGVSMLSTTLTISSVTCSNESNLTETSAITRYTAGSGATGSFQFFYLGEVTEAGTNTKTVTVTTSSASNTTQCFFLAVTGGDTASFFDADASATGTGTTQSVGVTTTADNGLIVAATITGYANGDATEGAGYTAIALTNWDGNYHGQYNLDVGSAASKTVGFTTAGSGLWAIKAAAFKAASTGPAITAARLYQRTNTLLRM